MPNEANPLALMNDSPRPGPDRLNFRRYAEPLVEIITAPATENPSTIGIFGNGERARLL